MTLRRMALLLAILTALIAAPSGVLAAPPNALLGATAAPPAGTTDTRFTLSVQYLSTSGTPAGSVSVAVAGRTLALSLVAGSPSSGTWAMSGRLPAGSWTTTFRASPAKGPQPVLAGPSITVAAVASTTPTPAPVSPDLSAEVDPSEQADGGGAVPGTTSPAPAAGVSDASPAADPAATAAPAAASGAAAIGSGSGASTTTPPSATGSGGAGGAATPLTPVASDAPRIGASPAATPLLPATALGDDSAAVWAIMIAGLIAVGAVGLIGGGWLVIGRRRRPASSEPAAATAAAAPGASTGETTDELLSRRSRNRRRMKPNDDPVLAAMGLDEPRRRGSRASQVERGAAMRDATRRGGRS